MYKWNQCCINIFKSTLSLRKLSSHSQKWDLYSAVSLERLPIITKEYNDLEKKFSQILHDMELENSYKSNFEIRMESDSKRQNQIAEGKLLLEELDNPSNQQTAQDFLDASVAESKSFKTALRHSENDNKKSCKRALDKHLLLVVKEELGGKPLWILPQGILKEGETLRETAERILREKVGSNLKTRFYGNVPSGFYKYKYPKSLKNDSIGAKIFFFKAQFMGGDVDLKKGQVKDYQWLSRLELDCIPSDYRKSVKMFLIDEY